MSVPAGWYVEGPDPSVGIFGTSIVHDECPADDEGDTEVTELGHWYEGTGYKRERCTRYRWTCTSCGETVEVVERDYDPADEETA